MIIICSSDNLNTATKYALCMSGNAAKMETIKGQTIDVRAWALYEDTDKKTGEMKQILSIMDEENNVYATISMTFIDAFNRMLEFFESEGETVRAIKVLGGTSKAGRNFVTCTIADM